MYLLGGRGGDDLYYFVFFSLGTRGECTLHHLAYLASVFLFCGLWCKLRVHAVDSTNILTHRIELLKGGVTVHAA